MTLESCVVLNASPTLSLYVHRVSENDYIIQRKENRQQILNKRENEGENENRVRSLLTRQKVDCAHERRVQLTAECYTQSHGIHTQTLWHGGWFTSLERVWRPEANEHQEICDNTRNSGQTDTQFLGSNAVSLSELKS